MPEQLQARYTCTWHSHIREIPAPAWDALALPLKTPFLEWAWLNNLEASGSATPSEGWLPHHLAVWQGSTLVAAAALYIKGHSYGEFVFDQQWADLAHRLGVKYYPKLLGMTPFTPAEGYRFLIAEGEDESALTELMLSEIDHFCVQHRLSGCSFLFVDPGWRPVMESVGCRTWLHHSYIWQNQSFSNFDDYLGSFNANQRRNIKRERKAVTQAGLEMRTLQGREIPAHLFPLIYHFYSDTCDKFWGGSKYLTPKFFKELHHCYPERVLLVGAFPEGNDHHPLAMAFCIHKGERLYGRYWGCDREIDSLHFEACYYAPIEWGIAHNVQVFDPGAGGRHKQRRGFPATPNYSLHRFYEPKLSQIFNGYIDEINRQEQSQIQALNQDLPFKLVDRHEPLI
jgi:predicted N-acyltransferase